MFLIFSLLFFLLWHQFALPLGLALRYASVLPLWTRTLPCSSTAQPVKMWVLVIAGTAERLTSESERVKFYTRWSLKLLLNFYLWSFPWLIMKYPKTKSWNNNNKTTAQQKMIKKNFQEEIKKTVATPQRIHEVV